MTTDFGKHVAALVFTWSALKTAEKLLPTSKATSQYKQVLIKQIINLLDNLADRQWI